MRTAWDEICRDFLLVNSYRTRFVLNMIVGFILVDIINTGRYGNFNMIIMYLIYIMLSYNYINEMDHA